MPGTASYASAAVQATVQQISYFAVAAPDRFFYDQGSSVTLRGRAYDVNNNPVVNQPVSISVVSGGYPRTVSVVSDSSGNFSGGFFPTPEESGVYTVAAANPSVVTQAVQSSFTIVGFGFSDAGLNLTMSQSSTYSVTVELQNTGATAITGLSLSTASLSGAGLSLAVPAVPASLAAGAQLPLTLAFTAAPAASTSTLSLTLVESHGFSRELPISISVVPAQVVPLVTPSSLNIGMLGGTGRAVTLTIQNQGFTTWQGVTISGLTLPWASVQGSTSLGNLAPGASMNVTLQFSPSSSQPNQTYAESPLFLLTSTNYPPVAFNAGVTITSSLQGSVVAQVINADKPPTTTIPGANVTLTSLDVAGLVFTGAADSNGLATFGQVPSGNYQWTATATGFYSESGTAVVEPGIANNIQVLMPVATVSYQWTVTPTNITDQYNITLNTTLVTSVPAPAVVITPASTNLTMTDGQTAYSQVTVTNEGLVAAFNVNLTPSGDAHLSLSLPTTYLAELDPGQTVTIPVKLYFDPATLVCGAQAGAAVTYQDHCSYNGTNVQAGAVSAQYTASSSGCGGSGAPFIYPKADFPAGYSPPHSPVNVAYGPAVSNVRTAAMCASPNAPQPQVPICPFCGPGDGADPTTGAAHPRSNAPIGFPPGSPAPSYDPAFNTLKPQPGAGPNGSFPGGGFGGGWAPPTQSIVANPDGSFTRSNTDGSQQVIVPIAPLTQTGNGNGPQFAVPVQMFDQIGFSPTSPTPLSQLSPDGTVVQYQVFGSSTYLPVSLTDKNGNTITYKRDPTTGNLLSETDVHGRSLNFSYNGNGQLAGISDSAGRNTAYSYDGSGNLASETDVAGQTTKYSYDVNHRITQITYPNGGTRKFTYDSQGRVSVETNDGGNQQKSYVYNSSSTLETDALGHVTEYDWIQTQGLTAVTRKVDPNGGVTSFAYDGNMNLISQTDPLGRTTKMQYDSLGNVTATTDANGNSTQTTYNDTYSVPLTQTDANGNKTSMTYDANADLITVQDAAGNLTNYGYDSQGHVTASKDPLGDQSAYAYNGNGALDQVIDPLGRTTNMSLDNLSRVTQSVDPMGDATNFSYDPLSNVTQVKDALNGITGYGYQAGRNSKLLSNVTDAKSHATNFGYDVLGRLTSIADPDSTKSYQYDAKDNLISIRDGNGNTITMAYDNLDRLITKTLPGEGQVNYQYDAVGNVTKITNWNGTVITRTYDNLNRITQEVQTLPSGFAATINYTYDANGNKTGMMTPWGAFSYTYDQLNRMTSETDPKGSRITWAYDAAGRNVKMDFPNNIEKTMAYDAAGNVTQILYRNTFTNAAVEFFNYTYNAANDRITMQDLDGTHSYGYDNLHRLISATHPSTSLLPIQNETFAYDSVGNRTSDAQITNYQYDPTNRMQSNSSFTYTYDGNGNQTGKTDTSGNHTSYNFDVEGQLVSASGPLGSGSYKYDGDGRRVYRSTMTAQAIQYVYDGQNILAMLDQNGNLIAFYTNGTGIDQPLIMHRADGTTYMLLSDALGSITGHTDINGNLVERIEYEAYGYPVFVDLRGTTPMPEAQSFLGDPFASGGGEWDVEISQTNRQYRHQDPTTGQFTSVDPIGLTEGNTDSVGKLSRGADSSYEYALDNPFKYTDPTGMAPPAAPPIIFFPPLPQPGPPSGRRATVREFLSCMKSKGLEIVSTEVLIHYFELEEIFGPLPTVTSLGFDIAECFKPLEKSCPAGESK